MLRHLPPVYFPPPARSLLRAALEVTGLLPDGRIVATTWLEKRFHGRQALLTGSGTIALGIALRHSAPRQSRGQLRVALPGYGCPDVGSAAIAAGASVTLYDLDPHTLQPDWDSVRRVMGQGATHLVVTHLFGRAVDVQQAALIAASFDAIVIEDSAQGADAFVRGEQCGSLADWSILSFGRGKGVNAGGGGALLAPHSVEAPTSDGAFDLVRPALSSECRHFGTMLATQILSYPLLYGIPARVPSLGLGDTVFHAPVRPTSITRTAAALIPHAFDALAKAAPARRLIEQTFFEALADVKHVSLPRPLADSVSGAHRVPILVEASRAATLRRLGVSRSYPRTLADYPEIAVRISGLHHTPGARQLADQLHTLPTHRYVSRNDQRQIIQEISRD